MNERAGALPWLAALAVVVIGHLSLAPNVADLDGFYHIGHAMAYLEGSVFDTALPWATRSVIADFGGDLWWGFHVLLLPFGITGSVPTGMRLAGLSVTLVLAATVGWVLHRHRVPGAGWWTALFLIAVPNLFFRYLMVRPHVLSLAASLALLSILVRGRWWQALLLSAFMSWVHLNLFWFAPGLVAAYVIARVPVIAALGSGADDRSIPIRLALPSVLAGTLLGWLARPDAMDTALLLNVQLVQLFTQKTLDQPLTFAAELSPLAPLQLARTSWLFLAGWLVALAFAIRDAWRAGLGATPPDREDGPGAAPGPIPRERAMIVATGAMVSAVFLALALFSARRAMEQWAAFGFLLIPFVLGHRREWWAPGRARSTVTALVALLLAVHVAWGANRHRLNVELVSFPATTLQQIADHIEEVGEPGDMVFHARWDNFGPLFAGNRESRYLGGMDPIFQYAHDPQAFWEFFYLSSDVDPRWTCSSWPCPEGGAVDTHIALRDHFGARWVVVEPRRNPRLSLYLLNDPRYRLEHETMRAALFEVLPGPEQSPTPSDASPEDTP